MKIYIGKSLDDGATWNFEEVLSGDYYYPSLAIDPDGRLWVVYWNGTLTDPTTTGDIEIIYSDDEGETWSGAVVVAAGIRGQNAGITINLDGKIWVSIIQAALTQRFYYSEDRGATWNFEEQVG